MILIDNSIELAIKTYLGLPRRVTGITISREKFREIGESFPRLLDAMEEYADSKLTGIDLGQVEWYHRLRNELYHQGNGLTVERAKVDVYAELAKILFKNLFETNVDVEEDEPMELLGSFLGEWRRLEQLFMKLPSPDVIYPRPVALSRRLREAGGDASLVSKLERLRIIRNQIVHGELDREAITKDLVLELKNLVAGIGLLVPTYSR